MSIQKVVSASTLAKAICPPSLAGPEKLLFGKIFEEVYSESHYYHDKAHRARGMNFVRKLAARLRASGLKEKRWTTRGIRMSAALIKAGCIGWTPRAEFRCLPNGLYVAAKPDLRITEFGDLAGLNEFKTCPINDYARTQVSIMAWAWEWSIDLFGVVELPSGLFEANKETIQCPQHVPESWLSVSVSLAEEQEFCDGCDRPTRSCDCRRRRREIMAWNVQFPDQDDDGLLEDDEGEDISA